jgi:hypothetical protein
MNDNVKLYLERHAKGKSAQELTNLRQSLTRIRTAGKFPEGVKTAAQYEELAYSLKQLAAQASDAEKRAAGVKGPSLDDHLRAVMPGWSAEKRAAWLKDNGKVFASKLALPEEEGVTEFGAGAAAQRMIDEQQAKLAAEKADMAAMNANANGGSDE